MQEEIGSLRLVSSGQPEAEDVPPRDDGNPAMLFVLGLFMLIGLLQGLLAGWLIWG